MKLYESFLNQMQVWHDLETAMESGEDTEDLLTVLSDSLDAYEMEHDIKALNIVRVIKGVQAENVALKAEADKIAKRMKANKSTESYLKHYLTQFCEEGVKLEDATSKISWRKSEVVEIHDEDALQDKFKREEIVIKIDKMAIKDKLKRGIKLIGAELITKQNIQIK